MRKFIISAAVAGAAFIAAAPAAAQYYQPAYGGYDQYQDNRHDRGNYGNAGRWSQELRQIRNDVERLSHRGLLDRREVRAMRYNISNVDNALRTYSRHGIDRREAYEMDRRIRNLQISMRRSANDADTRNRYRR